jgi:hypothetical protein
LATGLQTGEASDTAEQRTAVGGQGEGWEAGGSPKVFEVGEGMSVGAPVATDGHRQIVAAVFAEDSDLPRNPPHGRVVEE